MEIPPATDPIWADLISGKIRHVFKFLPAKILLGRLSQNIIFDPSPDMLRRSCEQIREVYATYSRLESVKNDLQSLLQEGGRA